MNSPPFRPNYTTGEGAGEAKTIQPEQERVKEMDESNSLQVLKKLEAIESLLRQLPEIMAATYIQMDEEYQIAKMQGKKSSDLWIIAPPHLR